MWTKLKNIFRSLEDATDGFHSFKDLYKIKYALTIVLSQFALIKGTPVIQDPNTIYEGYFVVLFQPKAGKISFYLPNEYKEYVTNVPYGIFEEHGNSPINSYVRILQWMKELLDE